MQCPLCRESVADDNALQVHYLVSCLGYLENPTSNKSNEALSARSSKKLVQFRWVKSKPTLAREVYLISSLAGSVKLQWRDIEECFLSDQVEVPQGLHLCQLVVDGDSMSTDDFSVSDTSRTIDILVPEASLAEDSTGNISEDETHEPQPQPTSRRNHGNDQDETEPDVQTREEPQKSSLYHELVKHQILHGDSLETLTGNSHAEQEESSGYQRKRGNGFAVGNSQHQRSRTSQVTGSAQPLRGSTGVGTDGDDTARPSFNISDLPNDRQRNEVLRDSMSSDELQQFLQPTRRTRQESEASAGREENDNATTEERVSSLSDSEENSVSVSSHDGFERRPELLGQSNGESNEPRVHPVATHRDMSDHVQDVDNEGTGAQSSANHRQETLLIDLRESSSGSGREASSRGRREISAGKDREKLIDDHHEDSSDNDPRRSSGDYRKVTSKGREQSSVYGHRELSGEHQSLPSAHRKHSSDDRERTSRVHERFSGSHSDGIIAETSGGYRKHSSRRRHEESSGDDRKKSSGGNHEATSNARRTSDDSREGTVRNPRDDTSADFRELDSETDRGRTPGSRQTLGVSREPSGVLRTEISGDLRQETTSGLQEKTSTDEVEPKSDNNWETLDDRREASDGARDISEGGREGTLGCEVTTTGREDISESPTRDNTNISDEGTSSVSTTVYSSLPTTLSPGITQDTQTEALINSLRTADTRVAQQENQRLFETGGTSTGDLISPRGSASLTDNRGLENEAGGLISTLGSATSTTGTRGIGGETRSLFPPKSSATALTRSHSLDGGTARTTTKTDDLLFRSYSGSAAALRTNPTFTRDTSAPSRDGSARSREESVPIRDTNAPSRDRDSPSNDASFRSRGAIGVRGDESAPSRDKSAPGSDASAPSRDGESPGSDANASSSNANAPSTINANAPSKEKSVSGRDKSIPSSEESALNRDRSASGREKSALSRDKSAPSRDKSAPGREESAPGREESALSRDKSALGREESALSRDKSAPGREESALSRDKSAPGREEGALSKDKSAPSRERSAPGREESALSRDKSAPGREESALSRDGSASSRNHSRQRVSNLPAGPNYPPFSRYSPQGSFLDDSDIRRPPLYTSAPSRPYSSLPYSPHVVISPLTSPRDGEVAVSSAERPGPNADTTSNEARITPPSSRSILDRQTPTGSAQTLEGAQVVGSGSTSTSKQFSGDSIKELLDSLKSTSSSRRINSSSPETSPRERLGTSEVAALKNRLSEREEVMKKLKAKNAVYKKEQREKEIELTKALSLNESSQTALKEQEEIASELTNALSEKEKQYAALEAKLYEMKRDRHRLESEAEQERKDYEKKILEWRSSNSSLDKESSQTALKEQVEIARELTNALSEKEKQYATLEAKVYEMKRDRHRLESEAEQERKDYEKKIQELRSINSSLDKEVKTLRQKPTKTSPRPSDEYKKLLEDCLESRAVSASLKDQVQKLDKENKDLKEKLNILSKTSRQEDLSKYTRDLYTSPTDGALGTNRQEHSTISINGYADTNRSPTFSRQQYDGIRGQSDNLRHRSDDDLYQAYSSRDITSLGRYPYDSHQPVIENTRYRSEGTEHRRERSRPQSEATRTQFDSQSQTENAHRRYDGFLDHADILRNQSDVYGSESFQTRESRSRRRGTTADDMPSSGISDSGFRQLISRRSHSSDSIRNRSGFSDGTQSKVSPSQERGGLETGQYSRRDKRSKEKTHLTRAGSYDNLSSRHTTTTSDNLALTGHRIDYSPTSPSSTSPRSDRGSTPGKGSPFAPHTPQQIDQGMTVLVSRTLGRLCKGVVHYIGYLPDKGDKVYLGLELHDRDGKHDGKFNERRFFKCKPNHGIFVPFDKVVMAYT